MRAISLELFSLELGTGNGSALSQLLGGVGFGDANDKGADAGHDADTLGDRDRAARVQEVEGVRALERELLGAEGWEAEDG